MVNEDTVRSIVADVLKQRFAAEGLLRADVDLAEDFDAEQIVRVTAHFEQTPVTALALFAASDEIRHRLESAGDDRFVFIRQSVRDEAGDEFEVESDEGRLN